MRPTLLLDLDGTLVDSAPDLTAALNRLMEARDLAPFTVAETTTMVGDGVGRLIERAFASRGRPMEAATVSVYTADYAANSVVATRLYPGVATTLEALRAGSWRLAVCTNKLEGLARGLLEALGIGGFFAAIGGGDSFPARKPDPAHLLATLRAAGGEPGRAVMAGDHRNDVLGAHGAGMACVFAAWGYGTEEMGAEADAVAARFTDLPAILDRLMGRD
ncbi:MAG: HAD family hydrolase [Acetobacteraceae bacterium]